MLLGVLAKAHAKRQFRHFLCAARNARRTQERVLLKKIARDADSEFGRRHRFAGIRSYDDFVSRVPIQSYEDIRPYIDRVMQGDTRALLGSRQRVLMFAMTSGSTDKPKYVPVTPAFLHEYRRGWNAFGVKALLDHPSAFMHTILQVSSPMDEHRAASGVPCGSISGLLAATQKRLVRKYYVGSPLTGRISDPEARYYTIMRLAVPSDVGWIVTASPATPLKLARSAQAHAERLIRDIHDGTLTAPAEVAGSVHEALAGSLHPDRVTARRLSELVETHGALLPKHYWRLAFLANWTGGTLGLHLRDFPTFFGDVPVRDIGLLATEGRVSIPIQDGTPAGVLDAGGSFFEFVDAATGDVGGGAVVRCHDVVPGREYRLLLTTSAGFYRYEIGDHVRVHGFEGEAPILEFLHRGSRVSSVTGEKLTEWQVTAAVEHACRAMRCTVTNFVLAPQWDDPPFYRLYLDVGPLDAAALALRVDEALARLNLEYGSKRKSQRLGGVVPVSLPDGTLAKLDRERAERRAAANEQYKHQYLLTSPGDDAVLHQASRSPSEAARGPIERPRMAR